MPQLDAFVSAPAFEEVCQGWLRREVDGAAVGWWWGEVRETRGAQLRNVDRELDAVAIAHDGYVIAIGSCKWTSGSLPYSEKTKLDVLGAHLQPDGPPPQQFFFSRNGFDDELSREAETSGRIRLVSPSDLF